MCKQIVEKSQSDRTNDKSVNWWGAAVQGMDKIIETLDSIGINSLW